MKVKFDRPANEPHSSLHQILKQRVNRYFKLNHISQKATPQVWLKALTLFLGYLGPYFVILLVPMPGYVMWGLCLVMGIALAGIGMSVMHDACHGAFSKRPKINTFLGYSMNLIGGNKFNWMVQHNVKHHTYTNIFGADEDLHNGDVIRLSPHSTWYPIHKFQHIYCWFLYLLGTISWVTIKDFRQFKVIQTEMNNSKKQYRSELTILILSKILYYLYMVVIPLMVLDVPWWYILIGFITIHFVAGFILSITFQLAHVVEQNEHHSLHPNPKMPDSWIVHQIKTTANFSRKSPLLNWYLGGLNFQIEHHLFPQICHVHYKKISRIVRKTVQEYGLSYYEHATMAQAIQSHYRTLRDYSFNPEPVMDSSHTSNL
ncbi:MAG: acyl-CoA desaturase [Cyclobacteriaceae bacterium]|nr:acyl-CoA desaturase [Cyclobacteriaceae bacterium]